MTLKSTVMIHSYNLLAELSLSLSRFSAATSDVPPRVQVVLVKHQWSSLSKTASKWHLNSWTAPCCHTIFLNAVKAIGLGKMCLLAVFSLVQCLLGSERWCFFFKKPNNFSRRWHKWRPSTSLKLHNVNPCFLIYVSSPCDPSKDLKNSGGAQITQ